MADIVLAECRGQAWLVSGEQHIDNLLANTLPPEISIELVACESQSEIQALWVQHCGVQEGTSAPWLIHPGVLNRVRRTQAGHAVFFGQWSVLLDEEARAVIGAAAGWAAENGSAPVVLVGYVPPDGKQALHDLARFRMSLIETELDERGIARDRMRREMRGTDAVPGMGEESQRVDIELRPEG